MHDEFGFYVYKVNVRREDEIVARLFPHLSLLLILCVVIRKRGMCYLRFKFDAT